VPVVLDTWAKETSNIEFYSDVADDNIPTINLGVPNTERGDLSSLFLFYQTI